MQGNLRVVRLSNPAVRHSPPCMPAWAAGTEAARPCRPPASSCTDFGDHRLVDQGRFRKPPLLQLLRFHEVLEHRGTLRQIFITTRRINELMECNDGRRSCIMVAPM